MITIVACLTVRRREPGARTHCLLVDRVDLQSPSSVVHEPPFESIDQILTLSLSGEALTPQQTTRLDAWLEESADHRAQFEQMRSTWQLLGQRQVPLPSFQPIEIPARPSRHPATVIGRIGRRRRSTWVAAGLAAALVVFAVQRSVRTDDVEDAYHFATAAGETSNVRLVDGTLVRLAPGSRLDVVPGSDGREVRLDGQAFFAVTHLAGRPFRVHTSSGNAKVLGTRFNVSSHGARVDLVVVDGRVELSTGRRRVEVAGGEESHAEQGNVAPAVAVPDVFSRIQWMDGTMLFNATPLTRVADEIAHRFGVRVEVDPSLSEHTVTAVFNDRPLSDVLDVVCGLIDARCHVEPDGARVRISARASVDKRDVQTPPSPGVKQ